MGAIFALAKRFIDLERDEIERLLQSTSQEVGVSAVSIMDFAAHRKATTPSRRTEL